MTDSFRFDAAIGGAVHVNTTADALAAVGVAPADVTTAVSAGTTCAIEAEMRRRIELVWAGKRPSAQSYWTALASKGMAATADEATDRDALASGDAWESAMLDAAKALAAKSDLDTARTAAPWPAVPAALLALLAEPFAL